MMLSIQLSPEEQTLLETAARRTGRQQTELMHQAVREFCQRMLQEQAATPYELGKDLFEVGILAQAPGEPLKRKIWEKLHEKHKRGLD